MPTRALLSRSWRSSEEFQTIAELERHDRRISRFRDRNWGKVFTLSVIKTPKIDFYGRGAEDDDQKNWDLGLVYQNELHASMKNLAYALRRDEDASQHNLLRWMICGSTRSDISDLCIGAINSLICVCFIIALHCLCLECESQLISTGRCYIHINSDDEEDNQKPNVVAVHKFPCELGALRHTQNSRIADCALAAAGRHVCPRRRTRREAGRRCPRPWPSATVPKHDICLPNAFRCSTHIQQIYQFPLSVPTSPSSSA